MNRLDACVVHTLVGEEGVWDALRSPKYREPNANRDQKREIDFCNHEMNKNLENLRFFRKIAILSDFCPIFLKEKK